MTPGRDTLHIHHYDETYVQVSSDNEGLVRELSEFLTFDVPGAQFMPAFKHRVWDGKKRLLDYRTGRVYKGLVSYIQDNFCKQRNYDCILDPDLVKFRNPENFEIDAFIESLGLSIELYDFQKTAVEYGILENRMCCVSPTSSGKSAIIYCLIRYYLNLFSNLKSTAGNKIMIVVPTIGLITQLHKEFKEYAPGFDIESVLWEIHDGKQIPQDKKVLLTTWQSIYNQPKDWFKQFSTIMVDEAHQAKADSFTKIFHHCPHIPFRYGFTGTLQDCETAKLVILGLTGSAHVTAETHELRDRGITSDFKIKAVMLKYGTHLKTKLSRLKYQEEIDFIINYEPRNRFLANLAKMASLSNGGSNVLFLTEFHEQKPHIALVKAELLKQGFPEDKILIAHGGISKEDREKIRTLCEASVGYIILATFGVFSTGISIKNLQYLICGTFSKSVIRILQSIGRLIRLDGKANYVEIFDIVDDMSFGTSKNNYLLSHFIERLKVYMKAKFKYSTSVINI